MGVKTILYTIMWGKIIVRGRIDMKGEIKNKYIEFVNHIDFPMILYVYESNKVIVMNGYAKEILGKKYEDIRAGGKLPAPTPALRPRGEEAGGARGSGLVRNP